MESFTSIGCWGHSIEVYMISLYHGRSVSLFASDIGERWPLHFFLLSKGIEHVCAAERCYVEVLAHIFGYENKSVSFAAHEVKPFEL